MCKPAKTSVPRNRVYSQYASRCGTERVVPLNPASFGKLVRVIFPGIQTRRLGVRGESKYHYVDLALEEESPAPYQQQTPAPVAYAENDNRPGRSQSASVPQIDFNSVPRLQADTAAFPPPDTTFDTEPLAPPPPPAPRGPASSGRTFAYPDHRGLSANGADGMTYGHTLRFPSSNTPAFSENEPVNLPPIQPYLPPRTDNDTAEALFALYRTHCTSLIDSIRFCKEKQFFRLYTSFHGTLTVPVQKLFHHPHLAPWIEECDLVMYRTMVRFVSRLTLQAAPVVVINIFQNISMNLHSHIMKTFASHPSHVLEAKLRPATVFAGLLHRLIRVNQSAHAAANLLTIDQNREQMWREWVSMVNPKRVMEAELPDCGYEEVYGILTTEMRSLLEPLQAPPYHEEGYGYQQAYIDNGGFANFLQNQATSFNQHGESNVSTDTVLDRWSAFISSLPTRFPHAPARTLLHCISAVGTAALRDITIMNGLSYGHWWVLKIFVDEMSLWMAEMGGFLEPAAPKELSVDGDSSLQSPVLQNGQELSHESSHGSRIGSTGGEGSASNGNGFSGSAHGPVAGNGASEQYIPTLMCAPFLTQQPVNTHSYSYATNPSFESMAAQHRQYAPYQQPTPEMPQHPYQLHGLPFQTSDPQKHRPQHEADIDDSGIGMSLMDEDMSISKFDVSGPPTGMPGLPEAAMGSR